MQATHQINLKFLTFFNPSLKHLVGQVRGGKQEKRNDVSVQEHNSKRVRVVKLYTSRDTLLKAGQLNNAMMFTCQN